MKSGIYCILCLINNKRYIGSTENFKEREKQHFHLLKLGKNYKMLQEDYNKYGEENFIFEIIEEISYNREFFIERENYWMDKFKTHVPTFGKDFGYNRARASRGNHKKESIRQNLSNSKMGKKNPMYGTISPNRKLQDENLFKIKQLLIEKTNEKTGEKDRRIANIFNCSESSIRDIRKGNNPRAYKLLNGSLKDWMVD